MSDYPRGKWKPSQAHSLSKRMSFQAPFLIRRANGPFVYDIDGYKYIDYELSGGEILLGHKPQSFHLFKNQLNRHCYGKSPSLAHYRLERKASLWLEQQKIPFKAIRFFDDVRLALNFLSECFHFSSATVSTWSLPLPFSRETDSPEALFFETLSPSLEEVEFPSHGFPILVENACLGRISPGLSLTEGWEIALVGPVISNGIGGALLISRSRPLPPAPPIRVFLAHAITTTLSELLKREQNSWPTISFPGVIQQGGIFTLPPSCVPENLLPHGILIGKRGFLSFAHTENEIRRLVHALQGQTEPSV